MHLNRPKWRDRLLSILFRVRKCHLYGMCCSLKRNLILNNHPCFYLNDFDMLLNIWSRINTFQGTNILSHFMESRKIIFPATFKRESIVSKSPNCGCSLFQMACKWLKKNGSYESLTRPETNIFTPENGWLEDDPFLFGGISGLFFSGFCNAQGPFLGFHWNFGGIFSSPKRIGYRLIPANPKSIQALCDVCRNFTDLVQQNATEIRGCVGGDASQDHQRGGGSIPQAFPNRPPKWFIGIPNHKLLVLGLGYVLGKMLETFWDDRDFEPRWWNFLSDELWVPPFIYVFVSIFCLKGIRTG